jgi:hypothetical protein
VYSCDNDVLETVKTFSEDQMMSPSIHQIDSVVINQKSYDEKALVTFSWNKADFGVNAAINYSIYLSSNTKKDFLLASNISKTFFEIDQQVFYDKLVGESNLALPKNKISNISYYVTATIGSNFKVIKSDSSVLKVNIGKIGLAGDLLFLSGDFNNWSNSANAIVGNEKKYTGYVDMNWKDHTTISYKFLDFVYSSASWGDWFGGDLSSISTSGGNITTTPGMKFFNVDLKTKQASIINFTKVGLTGINGKWATPALEMSYDYDKKYYWVVTSATTEKFRILCYSPEDTGWGWSYTMGPRSIDDLQIGIDSDVKVFDNSISKPLIGGDANMQVKAEGTYKFILYYTATDATWHFKVERP